MKVRSHQNEGYTNYTHYNISDNTTRNMGLRKKIKLSDSKFEFAGGVVNLCRLGYKLSVVNITTDVV